MRHVQEKKLSTVILISDYIVFDIEACILFYLVGETDMPMIIILQLLYILSAVDLYSFLTSHDITRRHHGL